MKKPSETANGPFDPIVVLCMTCAKEQASHEIHITCSKGLIYDSSRKPVFSVTYSVCGPCARQVVEVKLAADLRVAPVPPHDNTEASLRAELKRIRDLADKSFNSDSGYRDVLRKISQGVV